MAANRRDEELDIRSEILGILIAKVAQDRFPSTTMMSLIESILTPEEAPAYYGVLLDKIQNDHHPSISMVQRVLRFA